MTIGTGIAIAGVWVFAGVAMSSRHVATSGVWTAIIIAAVVTVSLA